jgi:hypothetical protein
MSAVFTASMPWSVRKYPAWISRIERDRVRRAGPKPAPCCASICGLKDTAAGSGIHKVRGPRVASDHVGSEWLSQRVREAGPANATIEATVNSAAGTCEQTFRLVAIHFDGENVGVLLLRL